MKMRIALAGTITALFFPLITFAIPFGGPVAVRLNCFNTAIFAAVGAPRPMQVIWSPATRTYQFGPPRAVGQWLLGLASAPYYCVYSIFPVLVAPGLHIDMMGSSAAPAQISLNSALTQGTPAPGLPPNPPSATCPGSPGPTNCSGIGHLLIGEVFGIVNATHGSDPSNEWVEIYNGAGATVNFSGWRIAWGGATTTLPSASVESGQILIFSRATSTRSFWNIPSNVSVVAVPGAGDLGESGVIRLIDPSGVVVDTVSWGSDTSAFAPAAPVMREGHSLVRTTVLADSNAATDWSDRAEPSPGN